MPRTRKPISQKIKDNVRISNYSDLELMEVLNDLSKNGTGAKTEDISKRLFGSHTKRSEVLHYANQCVTARMNWMRRFGFVEKVEDTKGQWRLSNAGEELRSAKVPSAVQNGMMFAKDSQALQIANIVGRRILDTNDIAFRAMERQLRFNIIQRKRGR